MFPTRPYQQKKMSVTPSLSTSARLTAEPAAHFVGILRRLQYG